jgi:uncharacterized membrane protein
MEWLLVLIPAGVFLVLPVVALVLAVRAMAVARRSGSTADFARRISEMETQISVLRRTVRKLSGAGSVADDPAPDASEPAGPDVASAAQVLMDEAVPTAVPPGSPPPATSVPAEKPSTTATAAAPPPARRASSLDLERRIGQRWATWVGVVALLFSVAFFLQWSITNDIIGPRAQVLLGLMAGVGLVLAGVAIHNRRLPYLSAGLSGGGLATLYLSLWAAFSVHGFIGQAAALACMFAVTVGGSVVSVVTNRQAVAVLTVLGGLLTPVLVSTGQTQETVLLGYLLVLELLVVGVARYRSWPALNRVAWLGTVALLAPVLVDPAERPEIRLTLVSLLFVLFLWVPVARAWAERQPVRKLDLSLVLGTAAAYYGAVYHTLEMSWPVLDAPWALALGFLYMFIAVRYQDRVPSDGATYSLYLATGAVFLTLAIPLALNGPWVTLAWAAQGVAFAWVARQTRTAVAPWGALVVLGLAAARVVVLDPLWYSAHPPIWNLTFLVHLAVVGALAWGGWLVAAIGEDARGWAGLAGEELRALFWVVSASVLAVLLWREPTGLWPGLLLIAETLALAALVRALDSRPLLLATGGLAIVVIGRILFEDHDLAYDAAGTLINGPLAVRILMCVAFWQSARLLQSARTVPGAGVIARGLVSSAGVLLLVVLSSAWVMHETVLMAVAYAARDVAASDAHELRMQVGLSVLWTFYAAAALAWGFLRAVPTVRYAALGLFGLTIGKVFLIDLSELEAIYRIASFFVLGLVLLGVSYIYQRFMRT